MPNMAPSNFSPLSRPSSVFRTRTLLLVCLSLLWCKFRISSCQSRQFGLPVSFGFDNDSSQNGLGRTPEYAYRNRSTVNYVVLAPSLILPSSVYTAVVTVEEAQVSPFTVTLSITQDGVNFQGATKEISAFESESLSVLVPKQLPPGDYKVRIEGNYPASQGGTLFLHQSNLTYSARFLSILIQTNRYVYTGGQKVAFRVILLKRDLKPYEEPVDVYLVDARGLVMRRWPSVASNQGVVDLAYELPDYTNLGFWKVRVKADSQEEEKQIKVEKYFQPQFEVYVSMPPFIQSTEETITAGVSGFYGSEKIVQGNTTVRLYTFQYDDPRKTFTFIDEIQLYLTGSEDVSWPMALIHDRVGSTHKLGIRVEAEIDEYFIMETRLGFVESRIITDAYKLEFVNTAPPVFKPGLPFVTYLTLMYSDQEKVPREKLQNSRLSIVPQVAGSDGSEALKTIYVPPYESDQTDHTNDDHLSVYNQYLENSRLKTYWDRGLLKIKFAVPKSATGLVLRAQFEDDEGNSIRAELTAYPHFSPSQKYISVWSTSTMVVVGEYVILRVDATYNVRKFYYVVMAKGLVLLSGTESLSDEWSLPRTFAIPVSSEMAPGFHVLVYHVTRGEEVTSDSVFIPVDVITRHSISLNLNQNKDKLKDTLEVQMLGDPGAYYGIAAQRSVREFMQAGNELSVAGVFQKLYDLEPSTQSFHSVTWRNRAGEEPDESVYLPAMSYGATAAKTFSALALLPFTTYRLPGVEAEKCELSCITSGCYLAQERCDGIAQCPDGTDEYACRKFEDDIVEYRVNRISRFMDFYDPSDGDWAWHRENIAHGGDYIFTLQVPKISDTWHFNGFSVSKKNGFALIESSLVYETTRPFFMAVDVPQAIKRGEHLGIVTILYNRTPKDLHAYMVLKGSDDFQFVHVKEHGNFAGGATFSNGDHQHFVWIPANSEVELRFPIRPTIDQGTITATITATTQLREDTVDVDIEVLPEGAPLGKHTSMLLDLKNRALVLKFIDIFTEETPVLPYDDKRKYIFGSPAGHVTLSGDVMGPIFPEVPVSMNALLGKAGKGTADRLFDLAANVWHLHYLRLTNQLEPSFARQVFVEMNKFYAQTMKRYSVQGWFKMWNLSRPSVWLSAWALQIFHHASFQDWETYFYVEKQIFNHVIAWLLKYQNFDGSFGETKYYVQQPLNKRMGIRRDMNGPYNVSLTAHLTITLHHVLGMLDGEVRSSAGIARESALRYLERALPDMTDPYEIAITAYTLTLADSGSKEEAFGMLHSTRRDEAGLVYWSPGDVPRNGLMYENQRPFIQPKNNEFWDSVAVEATSFALLTYLARDGVTIIPERIVEWLNTMRLTDGGFISTLDTIVAFEALTEYTNRARLRDITDMSVTIELASLSSSDDVSQVFTIGRDNIKEVHTLDIPNVWGHVNIVARGAGQALIQLDTSFGVDREEYKDTPPVDAFELNIREFFSSERNKSILTIEACFRWILTEESPVSGSAVLEYEIPSGYGLVQSDAIRVVESGVHPTLRDSFMAPGKTSWYFDFIPPDFTCFNHTVRRWQPVANLTAVRQATLYEAYAPERFINTVVNDTSLQYLSLCHVCGSYQCQYCPFYGAATGHSPATYLVAILSCVLIIYQTLPTVGSGSSRDHKCR